MAIVLHRPTNQALEEVAGHDILVKVEVPTKEPLSWECLQANEPTEFATREISLWIGFQQVMPETNKSPNYRRDTYRRLTY
jgi:hypothetical protein